MTSKYWYKKTAVITGASSGIGACVALKLANAGITVIGLARRVELIEELNNQITGEGKIHAYCCDLNDEPSILEAFKWIQEKFTTFQILVCNAGMIKANFLSESPTSDIKQLYDLNVFSTTICLREGLRAMRSTPNLNCHIIIMNSILGHRVPDVSMPLFSVYPASKHAIAALCQTVRQEIQFLKLNIKLTSINPGMVDTDFLKVYATASKMPKLNTEDVAQALYYTLETPPHVQVEDVTLQSVPIHGE
ncbi:farnesol dehydrogenase [Glossina fuscipes]|uniref:Farnesol dehydrogenase n=1 Tax=Glossina fuscipes TaxID=7396 RepID=A0A8U0WKH9_9MUSC|nr:farnesol dehydrogenase [Glossina fuscipes]KAI9584394.1 hypothetical protein GQX74_006289 [Glossina fuscipes]